MLNLITRFPSQLAVFLGLFVGGEYSARSGDGRDGETAARDERKEERGKRKGKSQARARA
jgi:hypothetical protein